jgi:hypothetical protein
LARLLQPSLRGHPLEYAYWAQRADASHQRGRYRDAERFYERAADLLADSDPRGAARYLLNASDNARCSGRFIRGYLALRQAKRLPPPDPLIAALSGTKELLFLRHLYQLSRRIPPLRRAVQRRAARTIQSVSHHLLNAGEYFDFQQLALWSRRFALEHDVTRATELYAALPIDEGYRQLAYAMAQMMAFRDAVLLGHSRWTTEVESEAVGHADTADRLGLRAEAWKLNYLLLKRVSWRRKARFLGPSWSHFVSCQYNIVMRVWQVVAMN